MVSFTLKKHINNNDNAKYRKLGKDHSLHTDAFIACISIEYMADANDRVNSCFQFSFFIWLHLRNVLKLLQTKYRSIGYLITRLEDILYTFHE